MLVVLAIGAILAVMLMVWAGAARRRTRGAGGYSYDGYGDHALRGDSTASGATSEGFSGGGGVFDGGGASGGWGDAGGGDGGGGGGD